jgi:glutamyl-Q tRNA(Asp) synthetase
MASYRGRFAPSPTGPLHIGSLTAALASYLDAKAHHGLWLVRMEDLDPPRQQAGAAESILNSLQTHGLVSDEPILWQSDRLTNYQQVIDQLLTSGKAFYCSCSRSQLQRNNLIHDGICSPQPPVNLEECAIRLRISPQQIAFNDRIQGPYQQQLNIDVGDVVLKRKDGLFAYQLAVVVDDNYQAISHCLRGSDLLDSTPRQIFLQQQLGYPTLHYGHIPVINNSMQQKLSKQNHAKAIDDDHAAANLLIALKYLNQPLPTKKYRQQCHDILLWATDHWQPELIPKTLAIPQKDNPLCN